MKRDRIARVLGLAAALAAFGVGARGAAARAGSTRRRCARRFTDRKGMPS